MGAERPARFDPTGQQQPGTQIGRRQRRRRQAARHAAVSRARRQWPLVGKDLLSPAQLRTANSADGRQRLGHGRQSARATTACTSTSTASSATTNGGMACGPAACRDQRPADSADRRGRNARPRVSGRRRGRSWSLEVGLTLSTRDRDLLSRDHQERRAGANRSGWTTGPEQNGKLPPLKFNAERLVPDPRRDRRARRHTVSPRTGPYYVEFGDRPRISKASAQFFLDWVTNGRKQIKLDDPKPSAKPCSKYHRQARDFWQDLVDRANAE